MIDSCQYLVKHLDNARYHGPRRETSEIRFIIWHATAGESALSSIEWTNRPGSDNPSSYHYVVERNGVIYRQTPIEIVAYHAGDSGWPPTRYPPGNKKSLNRTSIGIAFANRNDGEELTHEQTKSALWLGMTMMHGLDVPPSRNLGHYEVSPGRKTDPRSAITMPAWREMLATGELKW